METELWYVKIPPNATPYSFYVDYGSTVEDVRQVVRNWLGVKRLPNYTEAWKVSDESMAALNEDRKRDRMLYAE